MDTGKGGGRRRGKLKYIICYKDLKTGVTGKGKFKYQKKVAEEAVRVFNKQVAGFEHWIEPVGKEGKKDDRFEHSAVGIGERGGNPTVA